MVKTSNITADVSAWKEFLRNKVNSFIKWDLVRFFHDNPHAAETAENIARFTGRDTRIIQRELNGLVKVHVLTAEKIAGLTVYRLTDDPETRHLIKNFVAACYDREFRVQAISHVIDGMGYTPRHDF